MMKDLIIERIELLQRAKQESKEVPAFPNELELTKDINILLKKEIDSMIEEGSVKVVGITVNKLRILKLDKHN